MFFLEIGLVILGAVAVSVILLVLFAVARERKPLTGAALAISAPATAYAHAERRLLRARGLDAERRDFEIGDPAIRVHAFEIPGDGPPVVLIHGGGATAISWLPLLPELHGRHVFVVDRPGCGLTDGFDYSRVDLRGHGSAFIGSVLDALALERPVLVGNSMGGLWALCYALEHPERVAGIALLGTPAVTLGTGVPLPLRILAKPGIGQLMMLRKPSAQIEADRLALLLGRRAVDRMASDLFEASLLARDIPGAGRSFRTLARAAVGHAAPSPAEIASLKPPCLWVWGDADYFSDAGFAARVRQTLPASEVVVIAGAGHCPWLDDPARVGRALETFVNAASGGAMTTIKSDPTAARL